MKLPDINNIFFRITLLDKVLFTKHLAVMLKSGVPLSEAIQSLADQTKNPSFKKVLEEILADITNGQSFKKALSKHGEVFDALFLSLVSTGEESGKLEENLEFLSTQLKKSYEFGKKVDAATLYPKLVLVATLIMGGSISLFVLPQLVNLFESLDVELPVTTKILLFFANIMKDFGIIIISCLVAVGVALSIFLKTPLIKPHWHRFLVSVPIYGPLIQNIELTSICRNLGIMLKSGLTITTALDTQIKATQNLVFKDYLDHLAKAIDKGQKLSDEMRTSKFAYMPSIAPKMIQVGEETGKLEDVLLYLGDFFEEEVDDQTKNLSNTLEPILLLIIGGIVAFVALAIISPIYSLTSGIKK